MRASRAPEFSTAEWKIKTKIWPYVSVQQILIYSLTVSSSLSHRYLSATSLYVPSLHRWSLSSCSAFRICRIGLFVNEASARKHSDCSGGRDGTGGMGDQGSRMCTYRVELSINEAINLFCPLVVALLLLVYIDHRPPYASFQVHTWLRNQIVGFSRSNAQWVLQEYQYRLCWVATRDICIGLQNEVHTIEPVSDFHEGF